MANGWSLLISIIFIAVFSILSWFFSPKGENRTIWRTITFLAQWHPLIVPERADLRPEYVNGPAKSNGAMFF
ncbi:hypothetical protein LTR62_004750 [Meristemomyces frigidus]|uniref:Uncharacterized protein n=1 Tax=Meristemomyces frigidus TaxID=1508187 RepID=A0AAN7TE58_9PEZI|nr:hypothetical protein LTR62_004750 [Meristemomyces frigidus]